MSRSRLLLAHSRDLEVLLPLVRDYHALERIAQDEAITREALAPLLGESALGRVWLIGTPEGVAGYAVVCFGHSIEFGGRDAFLDEFFIASAARGRGLRRGALRQVCEEAARLGVRALHLEVDGENQRAKALYAALGFRPRPRFQLLTRPLRGVPGAG